MKKLLIGLALLNSFSSFANVETEYVNTYFCSGLELNTNTTKNIQHEVDAYSTYNNSYARYVKIYEVIHGQRKQVYGMPALLDDRLGGDIGFVYVIGGEQEVRFVQYSDKNFGILQRVIKPLADAEREYFQFYCWKKP